MTDYSRGVAGSPLQSDDAPGHDSALDKQAPGDVPEASADRGGATDSAGPAASTGPAASAGSSGAPADRADEPGSGTAFGAGFAPPDAPGQPGAPSGDKLLVGTGGGSEPGGGFAGPNPPRPGFVPHEGDRQGFAAFGESGGPGGPGGPGGAGGPGRPRQPGDGYGWSSQPPPPSPPFGAAPPPPAPGRPSLPPGPPGFGGPAGYGGGSAGTGPNWAPVPAVPPSSSGRPGLGLLIVIAVIVALVAGAAGAGIAVMAGDRPAGVDLGGDSNGSTGTAVKNRPPDSVAGVAQRVLPSVVMIKVTAGEGEGGAGTGFIVKGGYIITNNHVIASTATGAQMEVVYNDKKTSSAKVVGRDPSSDVAVIKPDTTHSLPPLTLGNSDAIAVGDPVIAIGSPLGLQGSVTTGIVSSLNRPVPTQGEGGGDATVLNAVQTDAAINPGNSGGPLVDMNGSVIGINTAIATLNGGGGFGGEAQGGSIGVGFAIPSNKAKSVAEQLISTGKARRAIIGIRMDVNYQGNGVRIAENAAAAQGEPVTKGGPADKAGLKPGDVITSFDGRPVEGRADLIAMITSKNPGDKVKVSYQRGGKSTTVDVTLGEAG